MAWGARKELEDVEEGRMEACGQQQGGAGFDPRIPALSLPSLPVISLVPSCDTQARFSLTGRRPSTTSLPSRPSSAPPAPWCCCRARTCTARPRTTRPSAATRTRCTWWRARSRSCGRRTTGRTERRRVPGSPSTADGREVHFWRGFRLHPCPSIVLPPPPDCRALSIHPMHCSTAL